jgi:hypothetical protein
MKTPFVLSFTFADLAAVCGVSIGSIYKARHRRHFDPSSLESVCLYVAHVAKRDLKMRLVEAALARKGTQLPKPTTKPTGVIRTRGVR